MTYEEKEIYLVTYNDCHGNGDDTSIEGYVNSIKEFEGWLKEHNKARKEEGEIEEGEEEFDLVELGRL